MNKPHGARPRVLALHGIAATPALWHDVAQLAPELEIVTPDVTAMLQSVGSRLGALVRALAAVVPTGPVVLTGCGVGANVALELAAVFGDRLAGLLLLNPQPLRPQTAFRERYRQLARTIRAELGRDELLAWTAIFVHRAGLRAERAVEQAEAMLVAAGPSCGPLVQLTADFPDADRTLARVRAPISALFGADHLNPFAGPNWIEEWRRALGPEAVELLPGTRQWLPLEVPDVVANALRGFVLTKHRKRMTGN